MAMGLGLCKTDNINRMITLSVITLSGFHCTLIFDATFYFNYNLNKILSLCIISSSLFN